MTVVPARACGPRGFTIPALAIGSWHTWDRAVFEDIVRILRTAIDAGAGMFDVGVYRAMGPGTYDSPTDILFARAMQLTGAARHEYQLGIKGWLGWPHAIRPLAPQVDEALTRLGTDYADVLVLGDITQPEEYDADDVVDQLAALIQVGAIRHWAVNNWSAAQIAEIQDAAERAGVAGPQFAQLKYGVVRRSVAEGEPFRELLARTGIAIQASSSFEGGLLLGRGSERFIAPDVGGIQPRVREAVPALQEVADDLGASLPQLALAFPLTNPSVANVLCGVRTPEQLEELLGAFALLDRLGAQAIRDAVSDFWVDRYAVDPAASWSYSPDARSFLPV